MSDFNFEENIYNQYTNGFVVKICYKGKEFELFNCRDDMTFEDMKRRVLNLLDKDKSLETHVLKVN